AASISPVGWISARSVARLTVTEPTPSTRDRARSTCPTQDPQVMPSIGRLKVAGFVSLAGRVIGHPCRRINVLKRVDPAMMSGSTGVPLGLANPWVGEPLLADALAVWPPP